MKNKTPHEINGLNLSGIGSPTLLFPYTLARKLDPDWQPFDYLVQVSNALEVSIRQGNARILMCWHPRAGKTRLLDFLIIWHLRIWPHKSIIFSSHSEDFSRARVRNIRQIISTNQKVLKIRLADDNSRADEFYTTSGGGLLASGIGSSIIRRSADLFVIDDIYGSWEDAQNQKVRKRVVDWFTGTAHTRLEPRGSIVVCGARWHQSDFQNYLLTNPVESWQPFIFPAISVGPDKDPLKRPAGAPLCPRYNLAALEKKRRSIGEAVWKAQYQQSPLPESESGLGVVFPREVIEKITPSPLRHLSGVSHNLETKAAIRYIGFDPGLRRSHSAYCVVERVDTRTQNAPEFHILNLKRYELETSIHGIVQELDEFSKNPIFGELAPIFVLDSSGAGGQIVLEIMKRERIVPIIPLTITSHKGSKNKFTVPKADLVENLLNLISAGRLKIAEDIPNRDLLFEELRGYRSRKSPQGRTVSYSPAGSGHDDLLDALMLACYIGDKNWTPLFKRAAPGLYGTVDRRPISRSRWELEGNLSRSFYAQHNSDYADLRGWAP